MENPGPNLKKPGGPFSGCSDSADLLIRTTITEAASHNEMEALGLAKQVQDKKQSGRDHPDQETRPAQYQVEGFARPETAVVQRQQAAGELRSAAGAHKQGQAPDQGSARRRGALPVAMRK